MLLILTIFSHRYLPNMIYRVFWFLVLFGVQSLFWTTASAQPSDEQQAKASHPIQLWYGIDQRFGHRGEAQRWINVLGNVRDSNRLSAISATLNDGEPIDLQVGSDTHRLANSGDFNIQLGWNDCRNGVNQLRIDATWKDGTKWTARSRLRVDRDHRWPIPYQVDFREVTELQDVVQIVDGKWKLTDQGVRTEEPYYDRVLCIGDIHWTNYDALVDLTIHDFTTPRPGPPTYNVTHFGIALRWRGHTEDGRQPSRRWHPLGAQGEFLVKPNLSNCQWRVLPGPKGATYADAKQSIELNRPLRIRARVETLDTSDTQYSFKLWPAELPEPSDWNIIHVESGSTDYESGAFCLVPHNTDVTIHSVKINPISSNRKAD